MENKYAIICKRGKMKKVFKILENTSLGIMVNGGFYLLMEGFNLKALLITVLSFYIMTLSIILGE